MQMYAVASTLIKEGLWKMNITTDIRPIEANSIDEAMGIYMREITEEFKEHNVHVRPVVLLTSSNSDYAKCNGCINNISTNENHIICDKH